MSRHVAPEHRIDGSIEREPCFNRRARKRLRRLTRERLREIRAGKYSSGAMMVMGPHSADALWSVLGDRFYAWRDEVIERVRQDLDIEPEFRMEYAAKFKEFDGLDAALRGDR